MMEDRAVRLSRVLRWALLIAAVLGPVIVVFVFFNLEWVLAEHHDTGLLPSAVTSGLPLPAVLPVGTRLLALAVAFVPTALTSFMLLALSALFNGYARGEVFTHLSVRRIRRVGQLLLVRELSAPLVGAAMSVALTVNNPPGQRMLRLSLESSNLTLVAVALMLMVAAYVMDHARELHEESLLTI